ncbi:putative ABC transporter domain-containing protein [Seiridium unicorne]|uniref:ABC transporter domain-containing protein n=1 Tax=Seiridium unicorne TaxID=138068 RepID=A0ABR2V9Y2_9PEZI
MPTRSLFSAMALNFATSDSNQGMDDLSNVTRGSHVIESVDSEELSDTTAEEALNDTKRQGGDFSVYLYYMSAAGVHMFLSFLGMTMRFGFRREFPTVWLKWWTEANAGSPNARVGMYFGICVLLGLSGLGLMIAALCQDMDIIDMAFPLQALNFTSASADMLYSIQQCLGFVLDMVVTVLVVGLLATVVVLHDSFNSGDVGVALTMVMTFNSSLMMLIKNWTLIKTSVGAVSRVKDYATTTDPEENTTSLAPLPADWPSTGAIQLSGLVAGHSPSSPPVLKGVSMAIRAGEKIAICGPSGSGKTSLILALLRMIEIQQGSITIDGANRSKYPRADIRLELNVVTQEPFLLAGTVRLNLDPFQSASDEDIIRALQS